MLFKKTRIKKLLTEKSIYGNLTRYIAYNYTQIPNPDNDTIQGYSALFLSVLNMKIKRLNPAVIVKTFPDNFPNIEITNLVKNLKRDVNDVINGLCDHYLTPGTFYIV